MAKYIYKYQFEKLLLYTEPNLWKKLVPNQSSTMLVFAPEEWQKTIMQRSWQKYDIERNPFYQLQKAQEILREGFITQTLFYSIKKKCVSAYWKKNFTFTKEWIEWYNKYTHEQETNEARYKWGHVFVKEYMDEQKAAVTESFSKKVLLDGKQVPNEVEGIIHEFMG